MARTRNLTEIRIFTRVVPSKGHKFRVRVRIDEDLLFKLVTNASENKSGSAKAGPLTVVVDNYQRLTQLDMEIENA